MNENIRDKNDFKWESIAINTWVANVPSGWLLKSIDTKHGFIEDDLVDEDEDEEADNRGNIMAEDAEEHALDDEEEFKGKKVPLSMANSMALITDVEHVWDFGKFKWINISRDT